MTRVGRRPAAVPEAAPQPRTPQPTTPQPTTSAGVVTRVLAACVDLAAVALATVLLDLAAAGVRFAWSPAAFRWPQPAAGVTTLVVLAVAVGYLTVAWAMTGRTYGARLLGLRVLSSRHTLLGWTRSVLRALTCVLLPVGLLWSGVSANRRSLQDVVFRSVVVYDTNPYIHPEVTEAPGRGRNLA
jgi:RDD family